MSATALKKHMGYDKLKTLVKAHKTQSELKFHANNEQKASTSSSSSVKQKEKKLVSSSAIPTAALTTEVLLAMQSVISHMSHKIV